MNRRRHVSKAQKRKLFEILTKKPRLRAGKFNAEFSYKDAQEEWKIIAERLNLIPGSKKDWKSWRKTWQDIFSNAKKQKAILLKSSLNNIEEKGAFEQDAFVEQVDFEDFSASPEETKLISKFDIDDGNALYYVPPSPEFEDEDPLIVIPTSAPVSCSINTDTKTTTPPSTIKQGTKPTEACMKTLLKTEIDIKDRLVEAKIRYYKHILDVQIERNKILKVMTNTLEKIADKLN